MLFRSGQLAGMGEETLSRRFGKHGLLLYAYVHGLDNEAVRGKNDPEEIKSIGNSLTFRRDLVSRSDISLGLSSLCESVSYRLRRHGKKCLGVQVAIKDPEFKTIDRQMRLLTPTHLTKPIYEAAMDLVGRSWKIGDPIRLLSVTAINLTDGDAGEQMSLFDEGCGEVKQEALEKSKDKLRQKYGKAVIKPAAALKNDLGIKE